MEASSEKQGECAFSHGIAAMLASLVRAGGCFKPKSKGALGISPRRFRPDGCGNQLRDRNALQLRAPRQESANATALATLNGYVPGQAEQCGHAWQDGQAFSGAGRVARQASCGLNRSGRGHVSNERDERRETTGPTWRRGRRRFSPVFLR